MESVVAAHQWTISRYNHAGTIQRRLGNRCDFGHPDTIYPCRDGHVAITVTTEEQAERFFLLLGLSEEEYRTLIEDGVIGDHPPR